ncbi:MAG TPA: sugar ABC transporter ATP-binding protein [Opitutaceae bacterium]|jgi:ABC-type sugar transport system ATPase subunit
MISEDTSDGPAGAVLSCAAVTKSYGGVHALRSVDWGLAAGEVHALCGENGAGKSSLARICAGIARADSGEVRLNGRAVAWSGSDDARRAGVGIILQELDLFGNLTVAENLAIGNPALESSRWVSFRALSKAAAPHLSAAGLSVDPGTRLGELSVSQWQLVAIARVLALEARVLFMDEPTSALTDDAVERLFEVIESLKARGVAIAYVSHKMSEIFRVCDRITVMRDGQVVRTSRKAETSPEQVIRDMVGRPLAARAAASARGSQGEAIRVENLSTRKLRGVSFAVGKGEVLGVAGLVASGRSELGRALLGMSPVVGGTVALGGKAYEPRGVRRAMRAGLAFVPEDRRRDGLFMGLGVGENTTLACLGSFATGGWIRRKEEAAAAARELSHSRTKYASPDAPVGSLSGGNQQKVLIAKCLLARPAVCFLDDPARGIDVGAKDDIYRLIESLSSGGVSVIWVSSELPELLANTHRILVMHEGAVAGVLDSARASQEDVMRLATGAGRAR